MISNLENYLFEKKSNCLKILFDKDGYPNTVNLGCIKYDLNKIKYYITYGSIRIFETSKIEDLFQEGLFNKLKNNIDFLFSNNKKMEMDPYKHPLFNFYKSILIGFNREMRLKPEYTISIIKDKNNNSYVFLINSRFKIIKNLDFNEPPEEIYSLLETDLFQSLQNKKKVDPSFKGNDCIEEIWNLFSKNPDLLKTKNQ